MLILISFSVSYPCYAAIQTPGGFWCVSSDILMVVNWRFVSPMLRENIYNDDDGWRLSARWGREEGRENRFHKYPKYAFSCIRSIFFNPSATRYTARRDSFNVGGCLVGILYTKVRFATSMKIPWLTLTDWLTVCLCKRRSHRYMEYILVSYSTTTHHFNNHQQMPIIQADALLMRWW